MATSPRFSRWTGKNSSACATKACLAARLLALTAALGVAGAAGLRAAPLVVRNATLLTMEADQPDPFSGYMIVGADGRISAIGPGEPPGAAASVPVLDAGGRVVMPGFLSGHSHLQSSAARGLNAGRELDGHIDFRAAFLDARFVQEGDQYAFTLHGALDYLRHGITTAYNYPNRRGPSKFYNEMFLAEIAGGQRFVYGYNVPDLAYEKAREEFLAFKAMTDVHRDNPLFLKLTLAKNGHLGRVLGHGQFPTEVRIAKEFGLAMQLHFLESSFYQKQNRHDFQYMKDVGALEIPLMYGHFIHSNDEILADSVRAGAAAIWNPLSNGRLASGLADIPKYRKAGLTVGMGLDGQNTADIADPFENMRMGLYTVRMRYENAAVLGPLDVLRLHTIGTANAIGVADHVGSLKTGKYADFLVVDVTEPDTGPVYDLHGTLVFACNFSNIARIYVGGDLVAEGGTLLHHDSAAIGRDVRARMARIKAASDAILSSMAN